MRLAAPPVGLEKGRLWLPVLAAAHPARMLVIANLVSLSRGVAALALLAMSIAGVPAVALLAVATGMWVTDAVDGRIARLGWDLGARPRTDGAALDPLMDDVAFVCGFLVLLDVGAVPLWFVACLLASRVLFALIRFVGLIHDGQFATPQRVTKLNGAVLAVGQILLLAHVAFPDAVGASAALSIIAVMTATTTYSVVRFALLRHGRLLARLLAS